MAPWTLRMTSTKRDKMTFTESLFGLIPASSTGQQWVAESMQLVNWGGYHGYHTVPFHPDGTLLSGASGSGKSTLLDAYIALMMPHTTPFNGASNAALTGRARGSEQRNILSYVRGKTDDRPQGANGVVEALLRGSDGDTWSAIAMTWRDQAGALVTAMRVFYVPRGAKRNDECVFHRVVSEGKYDVRRLEPFAAARFPRRVLTRAEGLTFFDSDAAFFTRLHDTLGIGAAGGGAKAMQLLARIQAGHHISTVDALYKQLVLEDPATFETAAKAVSHVDELSAVREELLSAEQQVQHLLPIRELHERRTRAQSTVDELDALGVIGGVQPGSAVSQWRDQRALAVLNDALRLNRATYRSLRDQRAATQARLGALEEHRDVVRAALTREGGEQVADLRRDVRLLRDRFESVTAARAALDDHARMVGVEVHDERSFAAAQRMSRAFVEDVPRAEKKARQDHYEALARRDGLVKKRQVLVDQVASLGARRGNIPEDLHHARDLLAKACGWTPADLPFVGELLEVKAQYEPWRTAISQALGGFAVTLVVAQDQLPQFRAAINRVQLPRRVHFEGVPTFAEPVVCDDSRVIPGRLEVLGGPFAGWLQGRLMQSFAAVCVDDPKELGEHPFAVTITGQLSQGRRGSHGGTSRSVLGFSNDDAVARAREQIAALDNEIAQTTRVLEVMDREQGAWRDVVRAHEVIAAAAWPDIDVDGARKTLTEREQHIESLTSGHSVVAELSAEERRLVTQTNEVRTQIATMSAQMGSLDDEYAELVDADDEAKTRLGENPGDIDHRLVTILEDRLGNRALDSVADLDRVVGELVREFTAEREHAHTEVDRANGELRRLFDTYVSRWPHPDLSTDPVRAYNDYEAILADLEHQRLHELRGKWDRTLTLLSGHELTTLNAQMARSLDDIRRRMEPVNDILWSVPFHDEGHRLRIVARVREGNDVKRFRSELSALARELGDHDTHQDPVARESRFQRMRALLERVRPTSAERNRLIDVREHVRVEAVKVDIQGTEVSIYDHIAGKSGGESQELVAFIVGAALRYQLGDADAVRPRYAPVFLDEAFIKADSRFAGRAVSAWKGLGFQLVIGAPLDKVSALEPHVPLLIHTVKDARGITRVNWSLAADGALSVSDFTVPASAEREGVSETPDLRVTGESLFPANDHSR